MGRQYEEQTRGKKGKRSALTHEKQLIQAAKEKKDEEGVDGVKQHIREMEAELVEVPEVKID